MPDNYALVRDRIAQIILTSNPDTVVMVERTAPIEAWLDIEADSPIDFTPHVNVRFDNLNFIESASLQFTRQKAEASYNIDMYTFGIAEDAEEGHTPGDYTAAIALDVVISGVRQAIMRASNFLLGMRGTVGRVWIRSITSLQPEYNGQAVQHIRAARIALEVSFNELAPEIDGEPFELLNVEISNTTGRVLVQADYDYTGA